ncbi:hypothetical protein A3K87_07515 [Variovorax paradoxus]|uniref:Uncharacterized protein n=1 Tax=Variovorax paradoxus TaxID=34073 RepID=A0AA91DS07_VARPD|nr:hypothetical protein A3K87_07515 [Variovorax paradoxus]
MTLTRLRVAEHQRIAKQFIQGNSLMGQQRMPCRHCHHERIAPDRQGRDPVSHFIGLRESHIVQIVMQPLDLLRQRHLEEPQFNFGFFLAA